MQIKSRMEKLHDMYYWKSRSIDIRNKSMQQLQI